MFACDECGFRFESVIDSKTHDLNSCSACSLPALEPMAKSFAVVYTSASQFPFVSDEDDFIAGVDAYFGILFYYVLLL